MDRARRAMPVGNKACNERFVKQRQEAHRAQLAKIKPTIDNKMPKTMQKTGASKSNAKKQQLLEDRYAQIERDNRILLEKMSNIMRSKKGGIDTENPHAKYSRSLNRESRRKDLQKITRENQRILNAIQSSEPFYSHVKWEQEARQNREYMKRICEMGPRA